MWCCCITLRAVAYLLGFINRRTAKGNSNQVTSDLAVFKFNFFLSHVTSAVLWASFHVASSASIHYLPKFSAMEMCIQGWFGFTDAASRTRSQSGSPGYLSIDK
jgi:hypothetical protein